MKKILMLLGSPRKNGNTALLAEAFSKGAKESGHQVTTYWIGKSKINPCKACDYCQRNNGKCMQQDDMTELYELLKTHNTLVIAAPVYYLGLPGSVKNVIDRTYAESLNGRNTKYSVLISAACKKEEYVSNVMKSYYMELMKYIGVEDLGTVCATGVDAESEVKNTHWIDEAYALGWTLTN